MARWEFDAKLVRPVGVGTWTFAPIPPEIAKKAGIRGRTRVRGVIDGVPVMGSVQSQGGGNYFIVVKKSVRDEVGKKAGDVVAVRIEIESSPPLVEVPKELESALNRRLRATVMFDKMSPSHRKAYAEWIGGAKLRDTRTRRAAKAVEMIAKGKHL
jgi:hypothetical protein